MAPIGTELRVGIFVFSALLIATALIFLVGSETNMFASRSSYHAIFDSVGGLRPGSPVRIGGVAVGTVENVELQDNGKIRVAFNVRESAAHLVREGSVATISSKGLLGDMLLEVSAGTGEQLPAGSRIETRDAVGLAQYMDQAGRVLSEVEATARNLATATEPLASEAFGRDVQVITHNLARLSDALADGKGPIYQLLTNEKMAANLERALEDTQKTLKSVQAIAHDVQDITRDVRHGDGLAHALIYDEQGARLLSSLSDASAEIAAILHDVRTNDSAVHNLLYEDQAGQLIENLTAVSADLRTITEAVREGRGTLGNLIIDPSLYEDVKRLVGDLERNRILRSIVRYSIREGERPPPERPVEVRAR
jgi:phospholipid/cholesterol/gamma-HCH transport system substrate-binding protein